MERKAGLIVTPLSASIRSFSESKTSLGGSIRSGN